MAGDRNNVMEEEINTDTEHQGSGRFEEDLKKLEKAKQLQEQSQCLNDLIAMLRKVNELTEALCTKKRSTYPPLTREGTKELKAAYQEAGALCTRFFENALSKSKGMQEMTSILRQTEANLRSDLGALDLYERMNGPVTLPFLLEVSRTDIIDLGDEDLGIVGGNLSSRIPFGYINPDGSEVKGVFTRRNTFNTNEILRNKIEELGSKYPDMKEYFDVLPDGYCEWLKAEDRTPPAGDAAYAFCAYFRMINEKYKGNAGERAKYIAQQMINCMENDGKHDLAVRFNAALRTPDAEGNYPAMQACFDFSREMTFLSLSSIGMNLRGAAIPSGSRLDSRNSGMSIVAEMMGVSKVIARSKPMKIRYKGEEIEGTFMELGKGREFGDPNDAVIAYDKSILENRNLGSASDLLVLDFICGNVDRHAGNILYQFGNENDPDWTKHVFLGVQGIDNDASFGEFVPKSVDENRERMAAISDIGAMKYSTAKAVLSMRPEILKFRLRGLELSDKQIDCACKRLELLQNAIEKSDMSPEVQNQLRERKEKGSIDLMDGLIRGVIRVIPDEKFGLLELDQLAPIGRHNVYTFLDQYQKEMRPIIHGRRERKMPIVPRTVNSLFGYVIRTDERASADAMVRKLAEVTDTDAKGQFKRTSKPFESLRCGVKNYAAFCKDHENQLMTPADYDIRNSYLKQIMDLAKAYLEYKGKGSHFSYTQKRVDAVSELLQQVKTCYEMTDRDLYRNMMKKPEEQLTAAEKTYRLTMNKYDAWNVDRLNARLRAEADRIAEAAKKAKDGGNKEKADEPVRLL